MKTYFTRLFLALAGRSPEPVAIPAPAAPLSLPGETELRARAAQLEMDLQGRDRRIEEMQREYAALQAARGRAAAGAGREQIERLFKKLAGILSNLAVLAGAAEAGRDVASADLLALFHSIEKELNRAGLERIGAPGAASAFDASIHQRMSGGTVSAGTPVVVRAPGYRMGESVLLKAMVSAREEAANE